MCKCGSIRKRENEFAVRVCGKSRISGTHRFDLDKDVLRTSQFITVYSNTFLFVCKAKITYFFKN